MTPDARSPLGRWAARTYAVVLAAIGLVLIVGGARLLSLGGSLYYLLAGLAIVASAVLLWRGRRESAWIYGAMLAATVVWALWEVGFDGWALMPRLVAPVVGGLIFLLPAISGRGTRRGGGIGLAALVGSMALGLGLHAAEPKTLDPVEQAGRGPAPGRIVERPQAGSGGDWTNWGGDPGGSRFSRLGQITPQNVDKLKVAWTADLGAPAHEGTPLKVGERLYVCTSGSQVMALDAETGRELWRFNPGQPKEMRSFCRGVSYYQAPGLTGLCAERLLYGIATGYLVALDAATGRLCPDFGEGGRVSLLKGMPKALPGYYVLTSPPAIVRGKAVFGGWVTDGMYWGEPSGVIRAYDAVTGKLSWAFDMGRPERTTEPPPGETYTPSTPNSWAPPSADPELGLVYLPTGNATPDYYGAQRRPFDDRYSSSVLALDAETGAVRWSFQTTHHDLWDYDVASQPVLVDLPNGAKALVQTTKRGEIFLLDRATGRPLAPVTEHRVPQLGAPPTERLSPTQPFSDALPSMRGPNLTEKMMWGITPLDQLWCRIRFREARYEGPLTPVGLTPAIVYPGYIGGMNWGSSAIDPERGLMLVTSNRFANYNRLISRQEANARGILPMGTPGTTIRGAGGPVPQLGTPYGADIGRFMSFLGTPCQQPPYGKISAVDLNTGKLVWTRSFGSARNLGPLGLHSNLPIRIGAPTLGGGIVTRSGLMFIGGSVDHDFRAISMEDGRELWRSRLPTGGLAIPSTYISPKSGRQFVVIAAGGGLGVSPPGNTLVAYALPKEGAAD